MTISHRQLMISRKFNNYWKAGKWSFMPIYYSLQWPPALLWMNDFGVSMHVSRCMCTRVSVCAAAHVTQVNIKAELCFAELTNLLHPSPRAAFETHTTSLCTGLWTQSFSTLLTSLFLVWMLQYSTYSLVFFPSSHITAVKCWRSEHIAQLLYSLLLTISLSLL